MISLVRPIISNVGPRLRKQENRTWSCVWLCHCQRCCKRSRGLSLNGKEQPPTPLRFWSHKNASVAAFSNIGHQLKWEMRHASILSPWRHRIIDPTQTPSRSHHHQKRNLHRVSLAPQINVGQNLVRWSKSQFWWDVYYSTWELCLLVCSQLCHWSETMGHCLTHPPEHIPEVRHLQTVSQAKRELDLYRYFRIM